MKNTSLDYQWVKLDKLFFNLSKHIFLCLAYIIPTSSSYIFQSDVDVLDRIEKDIVNHYAEKEESEVDKKWTRLFDYLFFCYNLMYFT